MDTVPLLFVEDVARLLHEESFRSLKDLSSGPFGNVGRSLWEKRIFIYLNVVFNPEAGSFDYSVNCRICPQCVTYAFDPADFRFVRQFGVHLFEEKSASWSKATWTTATPSDPSLLKWLRAPFARTELDLQVNCPEFLKLLPDYCTFNKIRAFSAYNNVLDAIIQRSQEHARLESVSCREFFQKRSRETSINWIVRNKRLKRIEGAIVRCPYRLARALWSIHEPDSDFISESELH